MPRRFLAPASLLVALLTATFFPWSAPVSHAAQDPNWPIGAATHELPSRTTEGRVVEVVDGDTIKVRITEEGRPERGETKTIRLIGMDTPETKSPSVPVECYSAEASKQTTGMLKGRTVYLEKDVSNTDRFDRLLRYVWFLGKKDHHPYMADELLVIDGYAVVDTFPSDVKYVERFTAAQDQAQATGAGLWASCGGADTPAEPTSSPTPTVAALITDCAAFASFEEAQAYYGANPAAQPNLDPNFDGRACEVFFGVDAEAPAHGGAVPAPGPAPAPAPVSGGCDPSYPGVCILPYPPDLDCGQVGFRRFQVIPPDPHGFDGDGDGVGCESA
jgi:micrococcal nuclease